ncbi:182 kDa tankyrase-1-binding protein isoform X1 [Chroicocephalus ridibundus]|uniref:182 kDa tankyrase-1-binding protein isoform X1 n=1 Tax=Chroicocephalus ridibundus TaxID=1192867 RepID=UPI002FDDD0DF
MASQPQPLRPAVPCASPTGTGGAGLAAGSPEKGTARPKPPVRPKPRVLPKPAVPAKPSLPQPPPGPRHPRPELPSAEKMNRLAGPQPYSGGGSGGPLRRPSFTLKSPETLNGKGHPSPAVAAAEDPGPAPVEEVPPAPPTPSRKGPAPFKVTPVPVATKPERFPGTTVEEILAKMDSREGPGSPDRARLSPFCPDPSSRFGSKIFTAFRRRPSGEADGAPPSEARQTPQPTAGELGTGEGEHPIAETSGSPPAGPSCAGDPRGRRRPPTPPDLSSLQPGALGPPGSPRSPICPAPGAPFQPSASAPGSPDAPPELPVPGSPTLAPGSPEPPPQPPAEVSAASIQAPGAPSSTAEPRLGISRSPGSPHTPGEGSPDTASPPGTPELPPRVTCPPGSPEAATEYPGPPSPPPEPPAKASRPPGSPEGPDDSPVSPQSPEGPDFSPPPSGRDSGLRRSSEGVLQPPMAGQGMGALGGSLSALPRPGDPPSELSLGSESGWSLSQSFEWTFPSRGARRLASPPQSPIRETADSGLSAEGESDGEDPAPGPPCSQGDGEPQGAGGWGAEGAPCPGGPVPHREAEGSSEEEEEEEGEAERDATVPCSSLCVTEPGQDLSEPKPPTQPMPLTEAAPPALGTVDDCPASPQGPGGPGQAEGPPRDLQPHADPGWLVELLSSPKARGSPQDLLGWSRKDLCSEFGIGRAQQAGTFDWTPEAVARDRDWPGETEQDREFRTKSSWDSIHSTRDGDRQDEPFGTTRKDWGRDYKGTELMGEARLGCSDWSKSRGAEESCLQDQDFGAGKPKWGTGYGLDSVGSGEEIGSRKANWSRSYDMGHGQQQDEEPSSRQPSWAGRYGPGAPESRDGEITPAWAGQYGTSDAEVGDRELAPDWASKYSSRDAESKDEDFTLGWAGRSSTGDTGTPEKEFSRPAWDSKYSTQDMESQDREFSPSRPAWTGEYSTRGMESQDREFSPSRPAEAGEYTTRDMESQDREFSPSRPAEAGEYTTRDMESQDREFSPSRPAWDSKYSTRDTESQDREFSPSRPAWDSEYRSRDAESQDREFSHSKMAWDREYCSRDMESQDREFSPSRPAEASECSTSDMETQDGEFQLRRSAWDDGYSSREMETEDREFKPSRPTWDDEHSNRDAESQDREFKPSRSTWDDEQSSRDVESQDREFSPSRPAVASERSTGDVETQDSGFKPSRAAWDGEQSTRDVETRDEEFSPSRQAWASECSSREMETQDSGFKLSRPAWDDRYSTRDAESQDREFSPSRPAWASEFSSSNAEKEEREFSPGRLSWAGECGIGQKELVDTFSVRKDDLPGSGAPDPPAQEPSWGSTGRQERGATDSRDWAKELGGAERHNQFGIIGTEWVMDPSSARAISDGSTSWAGGMRSEGLREPLGDWQRDLSFGTPDAASCVGTGDASGVGLGQMAWGQGLGHLPAPGSSAQPQEAGLEGPGWNWELEAAGWSVELCDAEAKRREWASAFGARCAARSRDFGAGEQSPGDDAGSADGRSIRLSDPSPPMGDTQADPPAAASPRHELPSPTEEERGLPKPATAPRSPRASPLLPEAAGGTLLDMGSEESPLDHPDGKRPPSWEEKRLSLGAPQPEGPSDHAGQEFAFLEDTEVLDSSVYRSKANLGRKRRHRAPALRPGATSEGDSWIFRDSTEPRPALAASSDDEAAEEPKSRRVRASLSSKGVKVPLFPGLSTSALKAKLRGRNRSAEEGSPAGDSKATPAKDPHVQRSKSCKIPGLSGKPLALPPKPEKSSGSEASPPHWLQALKLKKKKP